MEAIARSDDRRRMDAAAPVCEGALLGYAYFGHAGVLAASRQSGHVVGADRVAAFRAERRPLSGFARSRPSGRGTTPRPAR
jgi:hypothetical protein